MRTIKYSIIIPVYNKAEYLDECVMSVLNQPHEDIELLLINDGSTDNSLEICNKFGKKDHRVLVYDKKNTGVSDTRNYGIQKASGKYIVFLDADDILAPDFFSFVDKHIGDHDILLYGSTRDRKLLGKEDKKTNNMMLSQQKEILKSVLYNQKLIRGCGFNFNRVTDYVVSSEVIKDNGIRFDTALAIGEDKFFNFHLLQKTKRIAYRNRYLYYIRTNGKSVMASYNKNAFHINKALYTAFEGCIRNMPEGQLKDELNDLLDSLKFQVVRNSVFSNYCHKDNPSKRIDREKSYSECKSFLDDNTKSLLHDRDKYLFSVFQYPFVWMNIIIKSRVIRGGWYFIYKLFKR